MKTLTIITTEDSRWDAIATLLNGEAGEVTGEFTTDGAKFYNATFPTYGGEWTWIPEAVAEVIETTEEPA